MTRQEIERPAIWCPPGLVGKDMVGSNTRPLRWWCATRRSHHQLDPESTRPLHDKAHPPTVRREAALPQTCGRVSQQNSLRLRRLCGTGPERERGGAGYRMDINSP